MIRGKEALADRRSLGAIQRLIGKELFIDILKRGDYSTELELLHILKHWAIDRSRSLISVPVAKALVNIRVAFSHQAYIKAMQRRREFGDVTLVTLFSSGGLRIGYANTFQIKVGSSVDEAHVKLFGSHLRQLDFYRRNLTTAIGRPYPHICDFLYYWLVGRRKPHKIREIPLSLTWLNRTIPSGWPRYPLRYRDTVLRNLLLITGIDVSCLLPHCAPGLGRILEQMLEHGVSGSLETEIGDPFDGYPEKPPEGEFRPPEFPISSEVVVATEAKLRE